MTGAGPHERRVKCPTCGAVRWTRCRNQLGKPVPWYHVDRLVLADSPTRRRSAQIPAEVRELLATGELSVREVSRRTGIARDTLYRHGLAGEPRG